MSATIGRTIETGQNLIIGDNERRSGLYILGKPRMGKSWLIVNLILQDIKNGHGVFFLDPHGSAIDDILIRPLEFDKTILYDPEIEHFSFGINPLHCRDVDYIGDRNHAFTRTKGLFDKLWKNSFEEKPWLQLVLQNTIYAFIENPEFTIAEFPMFFSDPAFRSFIVGNMKYNEQVKSYWLKTFVSQSKHDQDEEMRAARTRVEIMLGHPFVIDILSHNTLNFEEMIDNKQIILFKLSAFLAYETKKIIGTIVVNELLHAVLRRRTKEQFCIFVDEFQTFASYQDFVTLITDAPKFGIATTLAHHERLGQLLEEPKILGATAAIGNKILFQITARDAQELAPEFAKPPPTETRDEDVYVISQSPFYDLLQGHDNPEVRSLINLCIRPIKERVEDIYGEKEGERLMRLDFLDMAGLHRIDEMSEALKRPHDISGLENSLARAAGMIYGAMGQTVKLKQLNEEGMLIISTIRILNRLFIDVMEEKIKIGSEDFSERLKNISKIATMPDEDRRVLNLYISLAYGDPNQQRILPFECAKRQRLLIEHVESTELAINTEYDTQLEAFTRRVRQIDIESILQENIKMFNKTRREIRKEPEMNAYEIGEEKKLLKECCDWAIDDYAKGEKIKEPKVFYGLSKLYDLLLKIQKDFKPLIRRQPQDIAIDASSQMYVSSLRDDLATRGYAGVVESVDGLTKLCALLGRAENHLMARTRQRVQKAVQTRTVADMVNEMTGELTGLSKYTAYATILQGRDKWKGQIRTLKLTESPYGDRSLDFAREMFSAFGARKLRILIARETAERQTKWRGDTDEPPPAESMAEERAARRFPLEADEPPPSHS